MTDNRSVLMLADLSSRDAVYLWDVVQRLRSFVRVLDADLVAEQERVEQLKKLETAVVRLRDVLHDKRSTTEERWNARDAMFAALAELRGKAPEPADDRLRAAAAKAGIAYVGSDTPDALAEEVLALRAALARGIAAAADRLRETKGATK